jgi:hypothetical protein
MNGNHRIGERRRGTAGLVAVAVAALEDLLDGLNENEEVVGGEDVVEDLIDQILHDVDLT